MLTDTLLESDRSLRKVLRVPDSVRKHLSVDGKRIRGTGRTNTMNGPVKDLQILNVYDNTTYTCLFSGRIEDKTNEIPHAQSILSQMELKNILVTFDALITQKETINIIAKKHGVYIGGLKDNQPSLNEYAVNIFDTEKLAKLELGKDGYTCGREIAHGQLEIRHFYQERLTPKQCKTAFAG